MEFTLVTDYWTVRLVFTIRSKQFADVQSLEHAFPVLTLFYLHQSSDNGYQRRTLPFLLVTELYPCLSHSISRLTQSLQTLLSIFRLVLQWSVPSFCFSSLLMSFSETLFM
jgi:hypothetical protein